MCACEGAEREEGAGGEREPGRECRQSTSLRSLTGSSRTTLRWFMARLKAIWTALRMLDVRPSIILILSMVLSIPRGTILDLGSHCLQGKKHHSDISSEVRTFFFALVDNERFLNFFYCVLSSFPATSEATGSSIYLISTRGH